MAGPGLRGSGTAHWKCGKGPGGDPGYGGGDPFRRKASFYAGRRAPGDSGGLPAAVKKYPGIHIIHFDAHADLRQEYLGVELSHACVLRRCWELTGDGRIHQFGIRSGDREEFRWGKDHVETRKFDFEGLEETLDRLKGKPVYFTLDLDVLDPSVFPEREHRSREEFLLRNCGRPRSWSAGRRMWRPAM